jgi:hypothetical protein
LAQQPDGERMSIYDAAARYHAEGVPLVVFAGQEYGTGSSRDWAAKGTRLLGVRAVVAQSFERIHRSNLVGPCLRTDDHSGVAFRDVNDARRQPVVALGPAAAAEICARAYSAYRHRRKADSGKESSLTPLPDFFIGAHALSMINAGERTIGKVKDGKPKKEGRR